MCIQSIWLPILHRIIPSDGQYWRNWEQVHYEKKEEEEEKKIGSLTSPSRYNHMMSTFVHSHFLFPSSFFIYWWVIDTDRLLFYPPVLHLPREKPLAFNAIPARVRLYSHRLHDYFPPVSLFFSLCLESVCVCVSGYRSWPSHMCVNVARVDQCKKEKTEKKKKKFCSSALPPRS